MLKIASLILGGFLAVAATGCGGSSCSAYEDACNACANATVKATCEAALEADTGDAEITDAQCTALGEQLKAACDA